MRRIFELLNQAGITSKYKGYRYLAKAILYYRERLDAGLPARLLKDIYPTIAKEYDIPESRVEQNVRYTIDRCWNSHRDKLCLIADYELQDRPTSTEFVAIFAGHLEEENGDILR